MGKEERSYKEKIFLFNTKICLTKFGGFILKGKNKMSNK